jgi:hypothetical protein
MNTLHDRIDHGVEDKRAIGTRGPIKKHFCAINALVYIIHFLTFLGCVVDFF